MKEKMTVLRDPDGSWRYIAELHLMESEDDAHAIQQASKGGFPTPEAARAHAFQRFDDWQANRIVESEEWTGSVDTPDTEVESVLYEHAPEPVNTRGEQ